MGDLLDLMGHSDSRGPILFSILSSSDQSLLAGRSARSCAAGRSACSRVKAGVSACRSLGADAPLPMRDAARLHPLHHALQRLRMRLCPVLVGARRMVCDCAACLCAEPCCGGPAKPCMVSTAAKPSHVVVGRVPCSLGAWGDVERPHRVATVSQPCSCPVRRPGESSEMPN